MEIQGVFRHFQGLLCSDISGGFNKPPEEFQKVSEDIRMSLGLMVWIWFHEALKKVSRMFQRDFKTFQANCFTGLHGIAGDFRGFSRELEELWRGCKAFQKISRDLKRSRGF